MGLDAVVQDILRRGEEKRRETVAQGEKEKAELISAAEKKASEDRKKLEARTDAAIAQMEQQELSSAELESKRVLLEAEKQVMEELREMVLSELSKYPVDRRRRLYSDLMVTAKSELGECSVYSNKQDKAILTLPSGISFGGVIECRGGLVFESKDGAVRLDYRFETILEGMWNAKLREIYMKLFG